MTKTRQTAKPKPTKPTAHLSIPCVGIKKDDQWSLSILFRMVIDFVRLGVPCHTAMEQVGRLAKR